MLHAVRDLLLVCGATFISCLFSSPLQASAMPGHVMSTPRPGRSSPSVCFGSCFVSWGEPTKGSAPHGAGKGMRRGEPMTEVTAHTSAGQLGWKKAQVSTGGRGGGARCAKDHESIGSPGSPASRCQCIGLVVPSSPCSLYITSPGGGGGSRRALWSSSFK